MRPFAKDNFLLVVPDGSVVSSRLFSLNVSNCTLHAVFGNSFYGGTSFTIDRRTTLWLVTCFCIVCGLAVILEDLPTMEVRRYPRRPLALCKLSYGCVEGRT